MAEYVVMGNPVTGVGSPIINLNKLDIPEGEDRSEYFYENFVSYWEDLAKEYNLKINVDYRPHNKDYIISFEDNSPKKTEEGENNIREFMKDSGMDKLVDWIW